MLGLIRTINIGSAVVIAAAMVFGTPSLSQAQTGSVRISVAKAGFIVGVGGGSGVLHFKGRNYPLSVSGVGVGTIGVARADIAGRVYNFADRGRHCRNLHGRLGRHRGCGRGKGRTTAERERRRYGIAGNTSRL